MRLLVIGGGILGTLVARRAALRWRREAGTMLLRLQDRPVPAAESLRNQAWRQSGLHYFKGGPSFARAFWDAGEHLVDTFRLRDQLRPGVMRIPEPLAAEFHQVAADLAIKLTALTDVQAATSLGRFYEKSSDALYFEVPDSPFPEAEVIEMARDDAAGQGVVLEQLDRGVDLTEENGRVIVLANGKRLDADRVVVAAGCGMPKLLGGLRLDHMLQVKRKVLLVVTNSSVLPASLLVDRARGFSVTHPIPGRLVFGIGAESVREHDDPTIRDVEDSEARHLREEFHRVTGVRITSADSRAHVGLELIRSAKTGLPKPEREVAPFVLQDGRFPNLVWAAPGRATMALRVAENIVDSLDEKKTDGVGTNVGVPWTEDVDMMFHHSYDAQVESIDGEDDDGEE